VPVSFAGQIAPMFREIDIVHMRPLGVLLDNYSYMSDSANNHANAVRVRDSLSGASAPRMPIGGPFWTQDRIDLLNQWMADGFQP